MVSFASSSKTLERVVLILTSELSPMALPPSTCSVPAARRVTPVKSLTPVSLRMPLPVFVRACAPPMAEDTTSGRDGVVTSVVKISSLLAPETRRPPARVGETVDPLAAEVCNTPPEEIVSTRPSAMVTVESAAESNRNELTPRFCERIPKYPEAPSET